MQRAIRVGIFDWCEFAKTSGFYPEDLPDEWRLDFYSNEFHSACLALKCIAEQPQRLRDWSEDLDPGFELSIAVQTSLELQVLLELCAEDWLQLHFLILDGYPRDQLLHDERALLLLERTGMNTTERIIELSTAWMPGCSGQVHAPLALMPGGATIRQYRAWVEQWLQSSSQEYLTLWFRGDSADYGTLADSRTLVELMGF